MIDGISSEIHESISSGKEQSTEKDKLKNISPQRESYPRSDRPYSVPTELQVPDRCNSRVIMVVIAEM